MLAQRSFSDDSEGLASMTCMAVLIYATYNTTNQYRQTAGVSADVAFEAMKQHCCNAVAGHSVSMRILDSRWAERPRTRLRRTTHQGRDASDRAPCDLRSS